VIEKRYLKVAVAGTVSSVVVAALFV
jgi:hypothetical protein